ncbi:MAG: Gx transporter family protein [Christensenellaceae bacterium]|nr:Gx transporter family protein [Christensenellaceae bacterium]
MRSNNSPAKRAAWLGVLAGVALALSIMENSVLAMTNLAIPGVKPGLANLAVVLALYYLGPVCGGVVALIKSGAVFLATGAVTTLWFSLAGSVVSVAAMALMWRFGKKLFSLAGVSAFGGALGNCAQLCVMIALSGTPAMVGYLPVLVLSGSVFGLVIGMLANIITARIPEKLAP